ncbi:MAG: biotin-dependent carboxyltransferase family protein [Lapillicoccus sp.]
MIVVERTGPLATVQDLGRPGLAHLGVGRSGAVDRPALRLANRLVGNAEDAAAVEVTLGGLVLRFERAATVALTGAPCTVLVSGRPYAADAPVPVRAGETLALGVPAWGLRSYLAVRGGGAVGPVLGSRSTDVLSGVGPPPLAPGTRLPVGSPDGPYGGVELVSVRPAHGTPLRVWPGPRDDWFADDALPLLTGQDWEVTPVSDRVGMRLRGRALPRRRLGELPSEGMVEGALQVPPDGQPVLFLADHPVTGGYPVVAVVDPADLPLAAQARPGERLRFTLAPGSGAAGRGTAP